MADDQQIWDEPAFIAVVLATLGTALVVAWTVAVAMGVHRRYDAVQLTVSVLARETAALAVLYLLGKRYLGISFAAFGMQRARWGHIAFGAIFGLILMSLCAVLIARFDGRGEEYVTYAVAAGTLPWQLALLALVGVYSPIVQELVFRGLLLQGLLQRMHKWVAIALSSVIFALVHASSGAASVLNALLFGVLTSVLFVRFRSLTAPIAAHVAVNSSMTLYLIWWLHRAGPFGAWTR